MKVALIGYGKMGKTIEKMGGDQGFSFPLIIDEHNQADLNAAHLKGIDVAIEFTTPKAAPDNILTCIKLGVPVVSGTTGWNDRFEMIRDFCLKNKGSFFYGSNFSIGVNILFAMNRKLARVMNRFSDYQVSMKEIHHIHKLDAPSGTAISLAEQILEEQEGKKEWKLKDGTHGNHVLPIEAIREGEVKGIHTITYESGVDFISLEHHAKSRDAFVAGVLLAARYLPGKTGVFGMEDLLEL